MEYILLIIIIMLIVYIGFKDITQAKHLERLEMRLRGIEPQEFDRTTPDEASNGIAEEKLVDLSMADPQELANSLERATRK